LLFLTAMIWGAAFVAQRAGMEYIGPFTFNGLRSYLGFLVLIPVILALDAQKKKSGVITGVASQSVSEKRADTLMLLKGGLACGAVLFVASTLQQIGMVYTTAGKGGFITALYIILVPVIGILLGRSVRPILWLAVVLATAGLYLLCIREGFSIDRGDLFVMASALGFSGHILVIDYFTRKTDGVKMSALQFLVCGILSTPFMAAFESLDWANIVQCWLPIAYAGVMSCGVAYTLQIVGQKHTEPTVASLIMSLESVFAVLAGILILQESLTMRETIGCAVMFVAVILAQLPAGKRIAHRDAGAEETGTSVREGQYE